MQVPMRFWLRFGYAESGADIVLKAGFWSRMSIIDTQVETDELS